MEVSEAVTTRRSVRNFLQKPVELEVLREILKKAARTPSGGNLQPWHIHIVVGERLNELKTLMRERLVDTPAGEGCEYDIYPKQLTEPYKKRRFEMGELIYQRLGIGREDKEGRSLWFARNFAFFGAPVGLFCYVNRTHGPPQWSDCGMYLQTLMLLLREAGLDSCPQECWSLYPKTIGSFLNVAPEHMLFTGMSIGWADTAAPENNVLTPRAELDEVVKFHGIGPNS